MRQLSPAPARRVQCLRIRSCSVAEGERGRVSANRAAVRPRVLLTQTGEALPLEDEILSLIDARARGVVQVAGPPGSGKTTALQHLAAVLPPEAGVVFMDDVPGLPQHFSPRLLVCTNVSVSPGYSLARYELAPWGPDEHLEYLLARHPDRCAAVLERLRNLAYMVQPAEVWCIVLEQMAADDSVRTARHALVRFLRMELPDKGVQLQARSLCLKSLVG